MAVRPSSLDPLELINVPILEDGTDPDSEAAAAERVVETLYLDRRLFGSGPPSEPFAYRASEAAARRVGDRVDPGELVVLVRERRAPVEGQIYGVRVRGSVELSRVTLQPSAMLLPAGDSDDVELIPLQSPQQAGELIAGRVVLVMKASALPEREEQATAEPGTPDVGLPYPSLSRLVRRIERSEVRGKLHQWTGNDDSQRHHHGAIKRDRDPLYLDLWWKRGSDQERQYVGCYRLSLSRLLAGGYVRTDSQPGRLRVRIHHGEDDVLYIQVKRGEPRIAIGQLS